jgi:hypothetical protein
VRRESLWWGGWCGFTNNSSDRRYIEALLHVAMIESS